jgi:uncharacterized membrane protein YfhO
VRLVERAPERWTIETTAPAERLLLIAQAFFPGWEAAVDGQAAPLVRADYLFQGVYVPEGAHRVELRYRPRTLSIGLVISVAAALTAAALFVPFRRPPTVTYQPIRLGDAPRHPATGASVDADPMGDR